MGYILNRFQRWNNVLTLEFLSFKTQNIVFREENSQISPLTSAEVIYLTRKPVWERQRRAEQGGEGDADRVIGSLCTAPTATNILHTHIMHCSSTSLDAQHKVYTHYALQAPLSFCTTLCIIAADCFRFTIASIIHCRRLSDFSAECKYTFNGNTVGIYSYSMTASCQTLKYETIVFICALVTSVQSVQDLNDNLEHSLCVYQTPFMRSTALHDGRIAWGDAFNCETYFVAFLWFNPMCG